MATVLISIEGVLRDATGRPIDEGVRFFSAVAQAYRVAVAVTDKFKDADWLRIEGLTDYMELIAETPGSMRGGNERLGQVEYLLGRGTDIAFVVDANPVDVAAVLHRGVPAMLFAHPKFARPEYRPDFEAAVVPWDQLVGEIETQTRLSQSLRPTPGVS